MGCRDDQGTVLCVLYCIISLHKQHMASCKALGRVPMSLSAGLAWRLVLVSGKEIFQDSRSDQELFLGKGLSIIIDHKLGNRLIPQSRVNQSE